MSCTTQQQQQTQFTVSVGALPEGFCGTPAQLAQAIADRLIIQVQNNLSSFVTGPNAPTSNQGPWLKNCERWYVWSDELGVYVPEIQPAFYRQSYLTASGNFVVPDDTFRLLVHLWGGGAGGGDKGSGVGGGGGAGGYVRKVFDVTPGQTIPYVIGAGGAHGNPGMNGGNTTFLTCTAGGGVGGTSANDGGQGGTAAGGDFNIPGGSGNYGIAGFPGTGGVAPQGGPGGQSTTVANATIANGVAPGGGGVGTDTGFTAGNGATGAILIEY